MTRLAITASRVVTCDEALGTTENRLGALDDAAVIIEAGRVASVCAARDLSALHPGIETIVGGGLLTPGLVDVHTHLAYAGSRHEEYVLKIAGASYEAIATMGGGILSTCRAVRSASREEITSLLRSRLTAMAALGVTTVEAKSGYGLDAPNERKQLEAIAEAASTSLPRLVPTFLALHALPLEAQDDRTGYIARVIDETLPEVARAGLCRFVDAYVDRNAFSVEETAPLFSRARELGLGVRIHAGQFADVGGAELAAAHDAASADHLEQLSPRGAEALARSGVAAVLLPIASFTLGQAPPDVAQLRRHGVKLVVASDANPGTAPTESLPLALALAARVYGLTLAEAILGVTREAANSLGLHDTGRIAPGARADLVLWDLPHEAALLQPWGSPKAHRVWRDGVVICTR